MVNIEKKGNSIVVKTEHRTMTFPIGCICLHADKNSDSVDLRLRASRKNIISFNYKDMTPTQENAYMAVEYMASLN